MEYLETRELKPYSRWKSIGSADYLPIPENSACVVEMVEKINKKRVCFWIVQSISLFPELVRVPNSSSSDGAMSKCYSSEDLISMRKHKEKLHRAVVVSWFSSQLLNRHRLV